MKNISDFLFEQLNMNEAEETIKSEEDFRAAARAKFEEVFGDELDEERMNDTIDSLIDNNPELVENGEWSKLIDMLNKSFVS